MITMTEAYVRAKRAIDQSDIDGLARRDAIDRLTEALTGCEDETEARYVERTHVKRLKDNR